MKKSLKGILASVIAMLAFAPSVKAQVVELTQADFAKTDVPAKSIGYDSNEGEYYLGADEYKFIEDVTLPDGDSNIYIHDADVTIDATGYTFKGSIIVWDSDITIVGGTFEGIGDSPAMIFNSSDVIIKNGSFKGNYAQSIHFSNIEYGPAPDSMEIAHNNTLMIENGKFTTNYDTALLIEGGKSVTIKNGTFTGVNSGLEISDCLKVAIEKGKFKATYDLNNPEDPYDFIGAIGINFTTDTSKINKLLSENSVWAEEVKLNVTDLELEHRIIKNVYTQPEISVITKEEKAAIDAKKAAEEAAKNKPTYKTLDGAKQEYDVNSENRLTFRFDIAYATFKASGKVFMDGVEVDKANYETKEGSTIVVFTKAYTETLKAGNHTVKVTTDEGEATAEFTIKKSEKESNPPTADSVILYIAFAVMSIGAAVVLIKKRRKLFNY